MNIIFLDVDGVLNCEETWNGLHRDGTATLDPELCDNLELLVRETNATVVLSSTWRLYPERYAYAKLVEWLAARNIKIHSCTKHIMIESGWGHITTVPRGEEIQLWLKEHEFSNYVILDDNSDMLPSQMNNFVKTSFKDGLTLKHVNKAIEILNAVPNL